MGGSPVERLAVALAFPAALTPIPRVFLFLGTRSFRSQILNLDKDHLTAPCYFQILRTATVSSPGKQLSPVHPV